jgi:hypothetical protein
LSAVRLPYSFILPRVPRVGGPIQPPAVYVEQLLWRHGFLKSLYRCDEIEDWELCSRMVIHRKIPRTYIQGLFRCKIIPHTNIRPVQNFGMLHAFVACQQIVTPPQRLPAVLQYVFSKLDLHQSHCSSSRHTSFVTDCHPGCSAMLLKNDVL